MDILYRSQAPAYRGCSPLPQQAERSGFLGNLGCYLFGGGSAPTYRTAPGTSGSAATTGPRCWWQAFPSTPLYKAAPPTPSPDDVSTGNGGDPACACPTDDVTDEDVLSTVYIVTD